MRVLSASKSEVYFKLRVYNSLPYLFSALRIATSTSVIGAVVGEFRRSIGQIAPEIEGEDIDGQTFKLSDYRGKVVVLDFWGNW